MLQHATAARSSLTLAEEVNWLQVGADMELTALQVQRLAAAPWDAGATQHIRAAHLTQLSCCNVSVPAKVGHPMGTNRSFTAR